MPAMDAPLTGKQKRALKALGQRMGDDLRVGKGGLSDAFLATLDEALRRKELVKVRFTELHGDERKLFALELADAAGAQCIATVGLTTLLYRANPELEPDQRVL
jgi:RNA-binding protein